MWTFRKAVIAATTFICFVLFLRFLSTSSNPSSLIDQTKVDDTKYAGRSYPASSPARSRTEKQKDLAQNFQPRSLRDRLQYQFPYDVQVKFPAFIWQTWKYDPSSGKFDDHLRSFEASWTEKHPEFVHEVVTDDNAGYLIKYLYAAVPEVVEAYKAMPLPVLKADFFRYLILFARGGIYTDIDTQALKPTTQWLPDGYDRSQVGLIVGIEADPDRPDWADWYSRRIQFCQWTIQSKPGHPVLRDIVARITEDTLTMKDAGLLKQGKLPPKSIVEYSGPAVWTDTIFDYFNDPRYFDMNSSDTANITWTDFTGMSDRKKLGDVIVLPLTSFSPGVGQMGAGDYDDDMAFVKHSFDGQSYPPSLFSTGQS